ncbi:MAG: polynucleotide adenylyltransferase PcnB [Vicinamibacterales bacterium]
MAEPRIVPRAEHVLSRRDIDPDALKVLYRLRQADHAAYLVGGSVRDLLIGRKPKDFDVGTSAHPYQIKRLFRNCWIIGRRFRLAHVRFGQKVIEVATFRCRVAPGDEPVQEGVPAPAESAPETRDHLIHRDNTFGTPEEDAFRRDFTINALFYDIATFSVIDYVGGLEDLRAGLVRSIGDPDVRFREDPVRMMRAVALASRLDFRIDQPVLDAIQRHRHEIARSSAPRLLEEYYKILRSGASEKAFRELDRLGLLEPISAELHEGAVESLWHSLAALDRYRRRFDATPDTLTNAILLGSLLVPLGFSPYRDWSENQPSRVSFVEAVDRAPASGNGGHAVGSARQPAERMGPRLGELPLARRDIERLWQLLSLQRRLSDLEASPRARASLTHRSVFREALTWLEIHGGVADTVEQWQVLLMAGSLSPELSGNKLEEGRPLRRRRRRRRRRFRPASS